MKYPLNRRSALLGGLATMASGTVLAKSAGKAPSVRLGVQTYSFRDMLPEPGDMVQKMIAGCLALDLRMVELFEPTIQPPECSTDAPWAVKSGQLTQASLYGRPPEGPPPAAILAAREKIRAWRLNTPLAHFVKIGQAFRQAGVKIQAFNFGLKDDCTDAEVDRGFAIARALGTNIMTASTTLSMARRTVPFVARHRMVLGLHGHSNLRDPNQIATPESFEEGLAMSPWYRINFDLGHFSAAGFDTLGFLNKHAERIVSVHLKDRKNNQGMNMPLGQGDTPVAQVLQAIARHHYPIPALFEYEYAGGSSIDELRRMKAFAEQALKV